MGLQTDRGEMEMAAGCGCEGQRCLAVQGVGGQEVKDQEVLGHPVGVEVPGDNSGLWAVRQCQPGARVCSE